MKRITTCVCALGFAAASWLAAGRAIADEKTDKPEKTDKADKDTAQPMNINARKLSGAGTVVKTDVSARELTLKMDDGNELSVKVPESVPKLDEIKKGDHVSISYYESVALSLKKQGEPGATSRKSVSKGKLPGGMVAQQLTASVEITKIEGDKLTVKKPDGKLETIHVTDDSSKADLAKLHEGDVIQATYTEAVAVMVTRDEKTEKTEKTK